MIRNLLVKIIKESNIIRSKISIDERNKLIEAIKYLPDDKFKSLVSILHEIKFHQIDRKIDQFALGGAAILPGGFEMYIAYRLLRKINFTCGLKCKSKKDIVRKKLCYKICDVNSVKKTIEYVKKELNDCWYHKNPEKCKRKAISYLKVLYDRLGKAEYRLNAYEIKLRDRKNK